MEFLRRDPWVINDEKEEIDFVQSFMWNPIRQATQEDIPAVTCQEETEGPVEEQAFKSEEEEDEVWVKMEDGKYGVGSLEIASLSVVEEERAAETQQPSKREQAETQGQQQHEKERQLAADSDSFIIIIPDQLLNDCSAELSCTAQQSDSLDCKALMDAGEGDYLQHEPLPSMADLPSESIASAEGQHEVTSTQQPSLWSRTGKPVVQVLANASSNLSSLIRMSFRRIDLDKEEEEKRYQHCLSLPQSLVDSVVTYDAECSRIPLSPSLRTAASVEASPAEPTTMHAPAARYDVSRLSESSPDVSHPIKPRACIPIKRCPI